MYDAVIWDFGGVLTTSPFEAFARHEREHGLPPDFLRGVNAVNHLENAWARLERGEIDQDGFDALFAEESRAMGHEVRGKALLPLLIGDARPEMVEALRRVGARLKTGCITNNILETRGGGERAIYKPEIMALFEGLYREGQTIVVVTHEHEIAEHALRQVHLKDGRVERDFVTDGRAQ